MSELRAPHRWNRVAGGRLRRSSHRSTRSPSVIEPTGSGDRAARPSHPSRGSGCVWRATKRSGLRLWQPRRNDHAGHRVGSVSRGRSARFRGPAARSTADRQVDAVGRRCRTRRRTTPGHPTGEQRSDTGSVRGAPRRSGPRPAGREGHVDAADEPRTGTPRRTRPAGGSPSVRPIPAAGRRRAGDRGHPEATRCSGGG